MMLARSGYQPLTAAQEAAANFPGGNSHRHNQYIIHLFGMCTHKLPVRHVHAEHVSWKERQVVHSAAATCEPRAKRVVHRFAAVHRLGCHASTTWLRQGGHAVKQHKLYST